MKAILLPLVVSAAGLLLLKPASAGAEENLIVNGEMDGENGWSGVESGSLNRPKLIESIQGESHDEGNVMRLIIERESPHDGAHMSSAPFPTEEGRSYTVSFRYKIISGAFVVKIRNGADNDYLLLTDPPLVSSDKWESFETVYSEGGGGAKARLCFMSAEDGICEMVVDDVRVKLTNESQ